MSTATTEDIRTLQETIVRELPRWIEEQPALRQRLIEALSEAPPQAEGAKPTLPRMTYEEFLEWADEDTWAEWVDGEVIVLSPASTRHQDIADLLTSVLRMYVDSRELGRVISAPFQMKLERGREPDLLFVAREHLGRLLESRLDGPADLVVEIASPDSIARDRGEKFYEYEAGGVREYWLIDPDRRWAEFYHLGEDGRYRTAFAEAEGVYHSEVLPCFWLRVEWLWQEPLPLVEDVILEVGGEEYARWLLERLRQRGFLPPAGE
nr:Uma2 family endonuclease [Anaerolineae bacterium]